MREVRVQRDTGRRPIAGARRGVAWAAALALLAAIAPVWAGGDAAASQAARWQPLDRFLDAAVADAGYVGVVATVWQDGRPPHTHVAGHLDLAQRRPMRADAIFRIYSMTKPVVSVAVLMLCDDGRIGLDDDIAGHLPEFADLHVLQADGTRRAPARALTIRHLLTHTSGIAIGDGPALQLREAADLHGAPDLAGYVQRLAALPLQHDPGTTFAYDGAATEVLARLVEVVSGQSLDTFLRTRLFEPLDMPDTGFSVPADARGRVVDITTLGDDGRLRLADGPSATTPGASLNPYTSGAGGLYSTAADYLRLCRMLLGGGVLDGRRYLREETVAAMLRNQLGHLAQPHTQFSPAEGFGLGLAVQLDPAARGRLGAPGQVGWSGAASTHFVIDPAQHAIAILLAQHLPREVPGDLPRLATPFYNLVQQGLSHD